MSDHDEDYHSMRGDALTGLAKLNRTTPDDLRDATQVNRVKDLLNAANGIKPQPAEERVAQAHLTNLDAKTEALDLLEGMTK